MVIKSAADVKRIPVGTKLRLIRSLLGPCDTGRIVAQVRSTQVVMQIDDPSSKNHGQESFLSLKGVKVEPRDNGFAVLCDGEVCSEYRFATTEG